MDRPRFSSAFLHPRYWPLWFGLGLLWLVVQLPYPVLLMLGRGLGALMYRLVGSRREIAARNLELCFPEKSPAERERLLKENFASSGIAFFEMAMSWWWPKARLARLAHIEGLEHLREAQAQGEGVILMALHFTTLEIGAALLGQVHTIDGMYREHDNPVFDYVQRRGRERHNLDATAIEREDVRSMLKVLRGGRAIWYAPDQDYGAKQSLFVPLFGIPAATVTATTKFARLGRARVLPFTQSRLADGSGYRLTIHPPLEDFPGESEEADCLRINQWVERCVRQQPEQYLWAHRRFKTARQAKPSSIRNGASAEDGHSGRARGLAILAAVHDGSPAVSDPLAPRPPLTGLILSGGAPARPTRSVSWPPSPTCCRTAPAILSRSSSVPPPAPSTPLAWLAAPCNSARRSSA